MRDRQHSFAEFMASATRFTGLTIVVGTIVLSVAKVSAQSTTVLGGHGSPSVEVDLSVLNSLPQPPTLPQLLHPGLKSQGARFPKRAPFSAKPPRYSRLPMPVKRSTRPSTTLAPTRATSVPVRTPRSRNATAMTGAPKPAAKPATLTPVASLPIAKSSSTKTASSLNAPAAREDKKLTTDMPNKTASAAFARETSTSNQPTGLTFRILFDLGASNLANSMQAKLDQLVRELQTNQTSRLQLLAYAGASDGGATKARRLSLSRALSVRAYLMDQGVKSTRMDVRALGSRSGSGPTDRVDAVITR